jgi:ABC-2 type transport system permease protein
MKLRGLWQLAWTEFKLNLREPVLLFFAIAFPTLWMGFFGAIFNDPVDYYGITLNQANFLLPGGIGVVICSSAFIGMSTRLSTYRETGVLKRLRVTPLRTSTLTLGFILSQVIFIALGIVVLFAIGKIFFDVMVVGSWAALIGVSVLGMLTFLSLGAAIGSVGSPNAAMVITMIIFTPMIFLSEMWMPISTFASWPQPVCKALPLTPLNTVSRDIVFGVPLDDF